MATTTALLCLIVFFKFAFSGSLEAILTQALVENKVDFVKLLLQNGIIMREYLTVDRLEHLYNSVS